MTRWAVAGLTAAILTQPGLGQNLWPAGAKQAAPVAPAALEERIVTMRTAGQPDRKVKVLRTETMPDGSQFTELKDVATGAVYSIMGPPPAADPFPTAAPAMAPGEKLVPVNDAALPRAKPRPADPLLGAQANLGTKSTSVAAAASVAKSAPAGPTQSRLAAALFGAGTPAPTPQPAPSQQVVKQQPAQPQPVPQKPVQLYAARPEPKQSAFSKALFGEWSQSAPQPLAQRTQPPIVTVPPRATPPKTVVAAKPTPPAARKPEFAAPVVAVAARAPEPAPPVMAAPPRSAPAVGVASHLTLPPQPSAPAKPVVAAPVDVVAAKPTPPVEPAAVAKPVIVAPPIEVAAAVPPPAETVAVKPVVIPPTDVALAPPPVEPPAAPKPVVEAPPVLAAVTPTKVPEPAVEATPTITQVSATVESETVGYVHQLANHPKPSGRIAAAMALSELPTVSRPEVVQALVAGAETDTVGVVRGNCILLLSAMGYAHPEYVAMLKGWEADEEPAVRAAVRIALAKAR